MGGWEGLQHSKGVSPTTQKGVGTGFSHARGHGCTTGFGFILTLEVVAIC